MQEVTITEGYRREQQQLHKNPNYGVGPLTFAPLVAELMTTLGIKSVSDYGAGKGNLKLGLEKEGQSYFEYFPYDPAFPEYGSPKAADLVCCIDVLEHIEPELVDNVLDELARITTGFGFFTVHMQAAMKTLSDGRNAHLIQQPSSWWLSRLAQRFEVRQLQTLEGACGFWVLVEPRQAWVQDDAGALRELTAEQRFEKAKDLFVCGVEAMEAGDNVNAEAFYRESLKYLPNRASTLTNLSSVLIKQKKYAEALQCATEAHAQEPENTEAVLNMGVACERQGKLHEALAWYDAVLSVNPEHSATLSNKGSLLEDLGRPEESLMCLKESLRLDPENESAWVNLGATYWHLRKNEEALSAYVQALKVNPSSTEANYNLSIFYLALQQFDNAWALYDHRWSSSAMGRSVKLKTSRPTWKGEPVSGTLLIWNEQGIGDTVLYLSMLSEVLPLAKHVMVTVPPRLLRLYKNSFPRVEFVDETVAISESRYDVQIAAGSLGGVVRTNRAAFAKVKSSYLNADPVRAAVLKARLQRSGYKVCGLSWVSRNDKLGGHKSIVLKQLLPLLQLQGFRFIDLQYGDTSAEREQLKRETGIEVERLSDVDTFNDLDGLAALVDACDLVVTVSNTTTHFAGALGKKTLLMVPYSVGKIWYWHDDQTQSIWYPSVQIHRQKAVGDWSVPIEAIRQEMLKLTKAD